MKQNSTNPVAAIHDCRILQNHVRMALSTFLALFLVMSCLSASAQIQQAWVARYNNGITNGTNQVAKMALDTLGNIYITGFSGNSLSNLGYATIKYAPNGTLLWAARYDSTNYPSAAPSSLVLDNSNNVIVTGSALTVKYDTNGNQLWTAHCAGTALAADTNGNIVVTGFGTNFNTVKLSPRGSNLWTTTYIDVGPTIGQAIVLDGSGNAYVSGSDTFYYLTYWVGPYLISDPMLTVTTIKYDSNGNQLWKASQQTGQTTGVQVEGAALDSGYNLYVLSDFYPNGERYSTLKYDSNGNLTWSAYPNNNGWSISHGLVLDQNLNVILTGQIPSNFLPNNYPLFSYGTITLGTNGSTSWVRLFPVSAVATNVATCLALDQGNSVYVTGYSPGTNSGNDIVTIKYDNNGNQIWLQRYNGPGNGDDEGNAIAVDASGNVYVAGYETTAAGGTEFVTIKYAPGPFLKKEANGSFLLQAVGAGGENFDFQASTNLVNWQDLGTNTADSNGLVQFVDTNAPFFPYRFYLTSPR